MDHTFKPHSDQTYVIVGNLAEADLTSLITSTNLATPQGILRTSTNTKYRIGLSNYDKFRNYTNIYDN